MVKGMKAVGKRVLSNEAANGQRPHQQQGAGRLPYSFFAPRESSLTCTAEDQNPNQLKTSNHARLAKERSHQGVRVVFRPGGAFLRNQRGSSGAASCRPACPRVWSTPRLTAGGPSRCCRLDRLDRLGRVDHPLRQPTLHNPPRGTGGSLELQTSVCLKNSAQKAVRPRNPPAASTLRSASADLRPRRPRLG